MRTGKGRVALKSVQKPVRFCGLPVKPGDIVVGGFEGLLVVPAAIEDAVLAQATAIERAEEGIRAAIEKGVPLKEARRAAGYHDIQKKKLP